MKRTNQPKAVLAEPIWPIYHCLGKGEPRLFIYFIKVSKYLPT